MARDISVIYDSIIDYKNSRDELSELNSNSTTAVYKLWAYIQSVAIFTHELLWDLFKIEVEEIVSNRINGTSDWYVQKAFEYQHGDSVQIINNGTALGYDPIIAENQIITRCAYYEDLIGAKGRLNLKIAKGASGSLEKLNAEELGGAGQYFERIKFAGTAMNLISIKADDIQLTDITAYHDGSRSDAAMRADLDAAMDDFMENLPFDGQFYVEKFRDRLQLVDNVTDIYIVELKQVDYVGGDASPSTPTTIVRKTTLEAGYAEIADKSLLKLSIES
jgi:hypothetical protein